MTANTLRRAFRVALPTDDQPGLTVHLLREPWRRSLRELNDACYRRFDRLAANTSEFRSTGSSMNCALPCLGELFTK
jgi:hypothetical protein